MPDTFKNSYKTTEKSMVSLSVYNVGFQRCEPLYQWGPGIRDHYLIHHVVAGKGYYTVGGQTFTLSAGDTFLVYPLTEITYHADQNEPWEYYWVGFSGSDAAAIIGATGFSKEKPVLLGQEHSPLIKNYLLQIYEARGQDFSHAVKMTGLLYLTLSLFLKPSDTAAKNDGALTYVQNAITYMNYHYPYDISIDDVAAFTGISRSHLYRIFMSHTGQSPKAYLSALRIRQACTLLKKSEISITAIAASVGFENSLYFSKVFKRLKGMTPTEYREN